MAWVHTVKFANREVKISKRKDGRFSLSYYTNGELKKTTTKSLALAKEKASIIAKELASEGKARWISAKESIILDAIQDNLQGRGLVDVCSAIETILATGADLSELVRTAKATATYSVSVAQCVDAYLIDLQKRVSSPYSLHTPKYELGNFVKSHDMLVSSINIEILKRWINRNSPSPIYYNNRLRCWVGFFNFAKNNNYLPQDKATVAELIPKKRTPQKIPAIFSIEEKNQILSAIKDNPAMLIGFAIAVYAGLRPSEIRRLYWQHLDLQSGYLVLDETICLKLQQARYVPILPPLQKILKSVTPWQGKIISERQWKKISVIARERGIIQKWVEDVTRHSFISYRLAVTQNINQVAEEAGNSPNIIKLKYRRPLRPEDGIAWFSYLF